jgi:16S rRNA (cytosine1402-N4)-methyltransferase
MTPQPHIPVLLPEVIAALAPNSGDTVVDGTFGAGGYTRALLAAGAHVIAIDRDPRALALGAALDSSALTLIDGEYADMDKLVHARGVDAVDGITIDIGVSSMQLDEADRGFSFQADGPLDMRMSQQGETAADVVNTRPEAELADIFYRFGDEVKSRRIAKAIVAARPVTRTRQLAEVVQRAIGGKPNAKHPATRTFQALRIYVNRELEQLEHGLRAAERLLKPGGRLAVVTFHSGEDKIVKQFLRERSGAEPAGSRHAPPVAKARAATFERVAKPVTPSDTELAANPRARSATLRAAVRTTSAAWEN